MNKVRFLCTITLLLVVLCSSKAMISTAAADSNSDLYAVRRSILDRILSRRVIPVRAGDDIYANNFVNFSIDGYDVTATETPGKICFSVALSISQNSSFDGCLGVSDVDFVLANILSDGHGRNDIVMYTPSSVTAYMEGKDQISWPVMLTPGRITKMYLEYTLPASLLRFSFIGSNTMLDENGDVYVQGPVYALDIQRMPTDFLLVNKTSRDIDDLYVVPAGTVNWGTEMLYYNGWLRLMPGLNTYISMIYNEYGYSTASNWSMKILMVNGDTITIDQLHLGDIYQIEIFENDSNYTYKIK